MAHGHRMISIHMFKVCQEASSKPFQNFHQKISVFCWMKNVVTAHKKCEKQVSRNFRSASSLLIFGKYLKVSYKIFYFSSFILVLDVESYVIHAYINLYLLHMKYIKRVMTLLRLRRNLLIYRKLRWILT